MSRFQITNTQLWRSIFRHRYQDTPRNKSLAISSNVFLHLHPVNLPEKAVRFRFSFCLGGLTFFMFLVEVVTGIMLMFYYRPVPEYAYLDMKYDDSTVLGLDWAGTINVEKAYAWDPATYMSGVSEADIIGIEAPLWSETLETMADVEYMAFPRLAGLAEIAWSPAQDRSWQEYRQRLAIHGTRLAALEVHFHRSPLVPWL